MSAIANRLRQRDARLARLAKRNPEAAKDAARALDKVRAVRDEADQHPCALCGDQAIEWQLAFLDRREGPAFFLYSDDVHDYMPHCSDCALVAEEMHWKALDRIHRR
ncbi:hypothetical protein [Streptomyces sp. NPDC002559]